MGRPEEADPELLEVHFVKFVNFVQLRIPQEVLFFQLPLDQGHCKRPRVDWCIDLLQEERQAPDMVFVTVGDKNSLDLVLVFNQVVVILDNVVDPEQFVLWEEDPAVNDDDFILKLHTVHVLTNFT